MKGPKIVAIVSAVAFSVSSAAFAQNSGTQAEQDACTPDVFSLCQDFIPNEGPIVACLKAKRRELSPACALVMFSGQPAGKGARMHGHHKRAHHRSPAQ